MGRDIEVKKSFFQLIKFGLVGVMNTAVDFLVYTGLVLLFGTFNDNAIILGVFTFVAYACGVLNSFLLNSRWTFKEDYKKTRREKVMFVVVNLFSWALSYALVWVFTKYVVSGSEAAEVVADFIGYTSPEGMEKVVSILAKLIATPIVIIFNFLGSKLLVFNGQGNRDGKD